MTIELSAEKMIRMLGVSAYQLADMEEQLAYITKRYNEVLQDNHLLNIEVTEMRRRENDFILSRRGLGDVLKDANPIKDTNIRRQHRVSECTDQCATEPAPGRL